MSADINKVLKTKYIKNKSVCMAYCKMQRGT